MWCVSTVIKIMDNNFDKQKIYIALFFYKKYYNYIIIQCKNNKYNHLQFLLWKIVSNTSYTHNDYYNNIIIIIIIMKRSFTV